MTNENTKILIASHLYSPAKGGAENLAEQIAEDCAAEGYNVKVVTTNAYSTEAFFLNDRRRVEEKNSNNNGIEIFRHNFSRKFRIILNLIFSTANRLRIPFGDFLKIYRFGPRSRNYYKRILTEKPDIIIALPFPMLNNYYALKAAKKLGIPLIVIPCFHTNDRYSFRNKFLFKILKEADSIIALTESERQFFINSINIKENKIIVVPPGIDTKKSIKSENKDILKKKMGIKEKNIVLYLGQHGLHKKILNLIKSMEYVLDNYPDTALIIAGGVTNHTKKIKKETAKKLQDHKNGNVYFFDNFKESEKEMLYQISDLFISLSEYESFGIVFIEAMKNGLPVIGSSNSVVGSIFENFKHGFLVDPNKPLDVPNAILDILENEKIKSEYSKNAIIKVESEFTKSIVKDKMLGVIKNALNRS